MPVKYIKSGIWRNLAVWPSNPFRVCNSPERAKIKRLSLGNFENTLNRLLLKSIFESAFLSKKSSKEWQSYRLLFFLSLLLLRRSCWINASSESSESSSESWFSSSSVLFFARVTTAWSWRHRFKRLPVCERWSLQREDDAFSTSCRGGGLVSAFVFKKEAEWENRDIVCIVVRIVVCIAVISSRKWWFTLFVMRCFPEERD